MNVLSQLFESETRKRAAWQKASVVPGYDPQLLRRDRFGNLMSWPEYGKQTDFGWELDHVWPTSLLGSDDLTNLAATHWKANRLKSNNFIG